MANFNYYWSPISQQPVQPSAISQQPVQPSHQPMQPVFSQDTAATEPINIDLKVLNPNNKKDFRMFVLRHVSAEIDSPIKFKNEVIRQYGDIVKLDLDMEIGYFHHSRKVWITSRLDVVDMWSLVSKGEKVTLEMNPLAKRKEKGLIVKKKTSHLKKHHKQKYRGRK